MKIKDIPKNERPREKLMKYGKENMSNSELLAILLKTGTKGESALDLAVNVLKKIKSIENLKNISFDDIKTIKGIGEAKAIELIVISELSKRIYYKHSETLKEKYNTPDSIYQKNKYLLDNLKQECFYCLYLNTKKELIERKLLFMGTLNKSVVHPREVFKEAYKLSASSIVCIHNHPSGNYMPSKEDIDLTNALIKLGKINAIPIIDHLIIGDNGYYSFYENSISNKELL